MPVENVRLGRELGRRLDLTPRRNFMVLDLDQDFLRGFRNAQPREKLPKADRFTGVGILIPAPFTLVEQSGIDSPWASLYGRAASRKCTVAISSSTVALHRKST